MKMRGLVIASLIAGLLCPFGAGAHPIRRAHAHVWERSAWRLTYADGARDGAPEVFATNRARTPILPATDWGAVKEIVAFCQDHKAGFLIKTEGGPWGYSFWGSFYGVSYQVNDAPPVGLSWKGGETLDGAVYPGDALAFLAGLPDEGSITFRVTDAIGRDHGAVFRLSGVHRASGMIAKACAQPL
jgi:hypothetical protein